ncbi:MAG TPA: hypothetical protein VJ806_12310 [Luteimonas sp.]|nr:hypothetical protein [Luteimonas sp.]
MRISIRRAIGRASRLANIAHRRIDPADEGRGLDRFGLREDRPAFGHDGLLSFDFPWRGKVSPTYDCFIGRNLPGSRLEPTIFAIFA